ncbi:hypothetical protein SCHPADRAFT_757127 [Schizopora paradoxa]|uniref:Uncharacterized protein n=1 Tax=Schizopora paradoxa TaxID=27342 RepID=A0A0H2RHE8_9AGAM|nr:hypothetical protein SCHPADRAFT_757127 [Schizopora paradoxa]
MAAKGSKKDITGNKSGRRVDSDNRGGRFVLLKRLEGHAVGDEEMNGDGDEDEEMDGDEDEDEDEEMDGDEDEDEDEEMDEDGDGDGDQDEDEEKEDDESEEEENEEELGESRGAVSVSVSVRRSPRKNRRTLLEDAVSGTRPFNSLKVSFGNYSQLASR